MSFPYLFIHSLIEVHRNSSTAHGLFFPIFIHRILLHLELDEFLASKPVHIIALIGDKCNFYMIFIILLFIKIVSFHLFLLI